MQAPPREAVVALCEAALRKDPTYRVIAYSTPETIFADISGARGDVVGAWGKDQRRPLPEATVLGHVGLQHLLHPRLAIMSDERVNKLNRAAYAKARVE